VSLSHRNSAYVLVFLSVLDLSSFGFELAEALLPHMFAVSTHAKSKSRLTMYSYLKLVVCHFYWKSARISSPLPLRTSPLLLSSDVRRRRLDPNMEPNSYDPFRSPDSTLSIDTQTPADSPQGPLQPSPGADSRSLSPEEPQQTESSPEISPLLLPPSVITSPDAPEQCESSSWPCSHLPLSTNTPPVVPKPCESGLEIPFQPLPPNVIGGPAASALSDLLRGHSMGQTSFAQFPEDKGSSTADTDSIFSDAFAANAETYRDPEVQDSEDMPPRTGRIGGINDSIHQQRPNTPQAGPQYTILKRPEAEDSDDAGVENKRPREFKPLPLPKDIPSTNSLVALGSPVEKPKKVVDPMKTSVEDSEGDPVYFSRIPNDLLLGTRLTTVAYNRVESSLVVQLPPEVIDAVDFNENAEEVLSTVDAQALALDSLSIYEFPAWNKRNDYRTCRLVPRVPRQTVTERRNGYRDCTREQLAWIEMMCSTLGAWEKTGSMIKFENLTEEDVAKMFFEKFGCEIPEDWTHLADHLRKGIAKMLCYRQALVL
jgi:hypothetical protein